jgi:hypothetical protein
MSRFQFVVVLGLALAWARSTRASVSFTEDFSSNPSNTWTFGVGGADPSTNRFVWNSSAPAAYAGDATGQLDVHLDSSLPTVRFQRPLGVTLTDTNDFTLTVRFSFHVINAPDEQAMQMAFGLVNSSLTGGDRTGTWTNFNSDDFYHTVEFDYFPSVSATYDIGPTLTPAVAGAQMNSTADAFANFASVFGPDSDLGDNTNGLTALPQDVTLQAVLAYTATNRTLALIMSRVNSNGTLAGLDTGLRPMSLVANGYNTNFPFAVDTLAIMAYQDGFTTTSAPSLVVDLTVQRIDFAAGPPGPPGYVSINVIGTNVVLAFPTVANSIYYVQTATNLLPGSWSTIATNLAGTGAIVTNAHVGGATVPARFYRVGLATP